MSELIKKRFTKYVSVGLVNTVVHWLSFALIYSLGISQSVANFSAFLIAVTFSFFVNARFTFKSSVTSRKYLLYTAFLGALALLMGKISDMANFYPLMTLVAFSATSLVLGFLFSHYVVFKRAE
ncbi:GtrA family protein [Vibrio fluvialis]|nr:GtrA family protein [Vibrio fluvialis]MBY7852557.1 GtrA family protein [Vibrio fluvialis]MBY7860054.1 GtrA family protein [Vibrio fluvialis]MBY8230948.1 GtrA family protein [Vibrio fluvialis]MBY8291873.1 GtrA family protein [Vibrio fluvialis]